MGLFTNKNKPCPVCGKATPKILPLKIQGEPICKDCEFLIKADFDVINTWSADDLREHLRYREDNRAKVESFVPTRTIECGRTILVDDNNRYFYVKRFAEANPPLIRFDSIKGFEVYVGLKAVEHWNKGMTRTSYQSHSLGVLGTIGAIASMLDDDPDKQKETKSETLKVMLELNDPYIRKYELLDMTVYGNGDLDFSQKFSVELARVNSVCDMIVAMAGGVPASSSQTPANAAAASSADRTADDILKFKKLLDAGVITQEEFDAKKKQLLGI